MRLSPMLTMVVAWMSCTAAHADPVGPVDTDRPDQTESSTLLPPRHLQLEFGVQYTNDGSASRTLESPATLIRLGVIERLELRFGIPTIVTEFAGVTKRTSRTRNSALS
jgi:hypothetical protein